MGQNKEQLKKLLDFLDELTKDKDNAWFVEELGRRFGTCYFSNVADFDAFVRLQHQKCRKKARQYYSKITNSTLRNQLIDGHAMMLWYKSIGELELFFVHVNYQIENMMNFYLDNTDCYNLINANPSMYCQTFSNRGYNLTIDCQTYFFDKHSGGNVPISKIKSLWAKILFWAVHDNQLPFVQQQFSNFSAIINIRNETNHTNYGRAGNSSKYWYAQEDEMALAFIGGIIRTVRNSILNIQ